MLDPNFIRQNPNQVKKAVQAKGYDPQIVDRFLKVDETRRQLIAEIQKFREARNKLTKKDVQKGKKIKEMLRRLEPDLKAVEDQSQTTLSQIPNLPASDVPLGKDESENKVLRKWGQLPKFSFKVRDYHQIGELLDIIDTQKAAKTSGTRFGFLKKEGAWLQFALIQYALNLLSKEGFIPVVPSVLIKDQAMKAMGYLEHGGDQETYHLDQDNLYLVGTSEQSIGPLHANETFKAQDLPLRYLAFSTCFRREAGTYGKDTRGIFRVHQFDKLEMFSFVLPQNSDQEHQSLLSLEEKIVQGLKLPYQVTQMCTGDLGHPAARKYDLECWFPAEKKYRETHSTSNCTDYQARRLNTKYQQSSATDFVHTLNGTALAFGRIILALLENNQQKDGSVIIPKVLQKFVGQEKINPPKE